MKGIKEVLGDWGGYLDKDEWREKGGGFFVKEIMGEKIVLYYEKEIGYSVEVVVEELKEEEKKIDMNGVI